MANSSENTENVAKSLQNCIGYLLDEAMEAKLLMVALHLKLAMDEAADAADLPATKIKKSRLTHKPEILPFPGKPKAEI